MCYNPRERFGIPMGTDCSVWALDEKFTVNPDEFFSKGRATPFAGTELYGKIKTTIYGGRIVW